IAVNEKCASSLLLYVSLSLYLHSSTCGINSLEIGFQSELISSKGYPVEEHNVITEDGYVLAIQRIPRGRVQYGNELSSSKTPVLFQHGFLGAASDYVINFPHQSLGFILADAGYDVWLGNFRGNTYSSHINLSRDSSEFWNFSADEMASEDLPSTIDTVLKITGKKKLQCIGWSQGALIMFALLSEKPEYNKKVSWQSCSHCYVFWCS
ncbi:lysosomal acid lipase/cholesteryl ester hydrolase, putative, partial [Ixodes scapularis]